MVSGAPTSAIGFSSRGVFFVSFAGLSNFSVLVA